MKHYICKILGNVSDGNASNLMDILETACKRAGATVKQKTLYFFERQGASILLILAESHATIHTWPEYGCAYVDYFSCAEDPGIPEFESVLEAHFNVSDAVTLDR